MNMLVTTPNAPLVLHIIPGLDVGGAERQLAAHVSADRPGAPRQMVVSMMSGGRFAERVREAGVPLVELGVKTVAGVGPAVLRIARLIRRERPVAVQSWLYYGDLVATYALRAARLRAATRFYWGVRCSDMALNEYGRVLRWAVRNCAKLSDQPDAIIANARAGVAEHTRLGYHPRAFGVIENGIDTARFRPDAAARRQYRSELGVDDHTPVVLHVARVDPMKDHEALVAIATRQPEIRFFAIGKETQNLAGPPNLRGLGVRDDMPGLYCAGDMVLSTSAYGEGFPNVIAEGMACGLLPVATNVGDSGLVVGETGIIVPARDRNALTRAIETLFAEPREARENRRAAARERVAGRYSLLRSVDAFDRLHLNGELP